MTRRAYTIVELFLAIFIGSLLVAIALPLFRSTNELAPQSVASGLGSLESAKQEFAQRRSLRPGTVVTMDALRQNGLLTALPPAPIGCAYVPGKVGEPATIVLAQ